jgi:hypothetical protein
LDGHTQTDPGGPAAPPVRRWIKWGNDIIGTVDGANAVRFVAPAYNEVVALYTRGAAGWTPGQLADFLAGRVVSRGRRDIERILFRCGLSHYDVLQISEITRGIHPKDLLWIARAPDEPREDVLTKVFESVFHQRVDLVGDSIDTPEGCNIKRYGVYKGRYGIYKQRISPLSTDVESEIAVYLLAQKLGVPCCPACRVDKDTIFSEFLYDFLEEYLVHFRRLFDGPRTENEYQNLLSVRPQYQEDIARMILLDFITRQDDRHLSNIAVKIGKGGESFYPLYDNGRSLFYEDTEELTRRAAADPAGYATGFGYAGTYWDYVREVAARRGGLGGLVDLRLDGPGVTAILKEAGFAGYRLEGARAWILEALGRLRGLM